MSVLPFKECLCRTPRYLCGNYLCPFYAKLIPLKTAPFRLNLAKTITTKPDDDCLKHVVAVNSKLTLKTIDIKYVLDAIGRLKNGKASGPDKVTIDLVKDAAKFIAYPIMSIINSSIANGVFPDV